MPKIGYKQTQEHRKKLALVHTGKKLTSIIRKKISLAKKGKYREENSHLWKGDRVRYGALHKWVYRQLGSPKKCQKCGIVSNKRRFFDWANISGEYKRDKSDWIRLCKSCHGHSEKKTGQSKIKRQKI